MNTQNRNIIAGLMMGLMLASPVSGFNFKFLDDAAVSRFSEQDMEIMIDTLEDALENEDDGVEKKWENPDTGHSGTITPLNRKTHEGYNCREVDISNMAGTFTGRTIRLMCKAQDGSWKVVPTS